jgi:hypothetical protein
VAAALIVGVFVTANRAWACSCEQPTPNESVQRADAVFTGIASGRVAPERPGFEERVEFAVETVYKGAVPSRSSVSIEATTCGYVFSDGVRYTVFALDAQTNLCMGNVQGAIDAAVYGVRPIRVYPSGRLFDFGTDTDRVALAAVVVVAAVAIVALLRRRSNLA